VLDFDGQTLSFEPATADARFEVGDAPACARSDWPTPATPWLVRDLDGSGTIDGSHELFGTGTSRPDGSLAANGFEALADLDANADGWLTADDPAWSELGLWSDHDRDRVTGPDELVSLDTLGVTALSLGYTVDRRCDERGNCAVERAPLHWTDAGGVRRAGWVVDVHLHCRRGP